MRYCTPKIDSDSLHDQPADQISHTGISHHAKFETLFWWILRNADPTVEQANIKPRRTSDEVRRGDDLLISRYSSTGAAGAVGI